MGTVRAAAGVPISLPGFSCLSYGTATAYPVGISKNRATLYGCKNVAVPGSSNNNLSQSVNDGVSWTTVHTFANPPLGLIETDDGEALCITQNAASAPGMLYKSSGWSTSHTTATWTLVLTTTGGFFRPAWAGGHFCSFGNDAITANTSKYGVINEYGPQTTSTDSTTKATRVWFTSDYGATWTQVLDLGARYPGVFPLHVHATAYDPYWDRLWVTFGDTSTDAGMVVMLYSDDHGATWNTISRPTEFSASTLQSTSIAVLPDSIVLGSDNAPGSFRIARHGYRVMSPLQENFVVGPASGTQMIATACHMQPGGPLLMAWQAANTENAPGIVASFDGGATFTEVWRDEDSRIASTGPQTVVGPTASGTYLSQVLRSGSIVWQLRASLITPPAGLLDGFGAFTGDGTTTVFNVAHGLGVVPSRLYGWGLTIPTSGFTVTSDATNIIFTFTVAPAAAASCRVAYRVGV